MGFHVIYFIRMKLNADRDAAQKRLNYCSCFVQLSSLIHTSPQTFLSIA